MIKKFIDRLLGKTASGKPAVPLGKRVEIGAADQVSELGRAACRARGEISVVAVA